MPNRTTPAPSGSVIAYTGGRKKECRTLSASKNGCNVQIINTKGIEPFLPTIIIVQVV